jgi:hypothetical protein
LGGQLVGSRLEPYGVAGADDDIRLFGCEFLGDGAADAQASAGDDGDLAGQVQVHGRRTMRDRSVIDPPWPRMR